MSWAARAWVQARSRTLKLGSSKKRSCGSVRRKATESDLPVISERACRLTTYPVLRIAASTAAFADGLT